MLMDDWYILVCYAQARCCPMQMYSLIACCWSFLNVTSLLQLLTVSFVVVVLIPHRVSVDLFDHLYNYVEVILNCRLLSTDYSTQFNNKIK